MLFHLTKGFSPGFLFLGSLMALGSFFEPRLIKNADVNLNVVQEENNILVSVKSSRIMRRIQFYMFNLEGSLVKEYDISGSKVITICLLPKGIYLYEFFNNDQRLKNGKIELK